MNRSITVSSAAIVAMLFGACSAADGTPSMSAEAKEASTRFDDLIDHRSYECSNAPGLLNITYDQPGAHSFGSYIKHYQFKGFSYDVQENEISEAEQQNGVSFSGWLIFKPDAIVRHRLQERGRWGPWKDWSNLYRDDLAMDAGHYIEIRNNRLNCEKRGWQTLSGSEVLVDMFSDGGLRKAQRGVC